MSLQMQQYYARPTNQFWRLIGAVIEQDLAALPYDRKLTALRSAGIGLWDVVKQAQRSGSGDSAIRDHQPNALDNFAASLPGLKALAFNGGTSSAIGRKQVSPASGLALVTLPSSSAAYCRITYGQKLETWLTLRAFLS